ncbi:MAG: TraB/GumN family protein [Steroidobacterales bacterium]|jgi:uncharacterized protein YbaP (TraB family)
MQSVPVALLSVCLGLLMIPVSGAQQAAAADPQAAPAALPEIVVEGHHQGPRLWRVRRGDHVLWILGTVSPLPRKMIWQPDAVREVLKESQEVVPAWPTYGIGANPITALRVYVQWRRMQKPPDHMPLREAVPPQLYARVEALEARYGPRDKTLEQLRPMLAAEHLLTKVLDSAGLTARNEVQQTVLQLARAQGVRVRQDKLRIEDPVEVLKDVGATPLSGEVACLDAVVTRLETDLGPMQARARAWALGDVATLRDLPHTDNRTACVAAVSTSERVRTIIQRAEEDWLVAVQDSLARNRGTLGVQSMDRLLGERGALAALKARGYEVEGP